MQDIGQFVGDNIGGLERFQFIPVDDIISIPRANDYRIEEEISLQGGAIWFNAYVTAESIGYKETEQKGKHGKSYNRILKGFVPKDTADLANQFDEMEGDLYVLIYDDNNGNRKVVGSIESPLEFKANLDTKESTSGRNGHDITFSGKSKHKAYFYNPAQGSISGS